MDILLCCDTSTTFLTLGLCSRKRVRGAPMQMLGELTFNAGRRHAETLLPATQQLLGQCSLTLQDVTLLAVTTGPGSFTGLRIGVAAWKGLAYALNLPLIGVPTLDALSRLHPWNDVTVCTLLDAKMSEVFAATYVFKNAQRETLREAAALPPEQAIAGLPADTVFCGDGALRYADDIRAQYPNAPLLNEGWSAPRATALAMEAFYRYDAGMPHDAARVEPVYLRQTQAETNRDLREAAAREA
jgi:tRNA threonylcarbamoyladenosine biosynthesis protein TsaB